jgi:hypothetical protein
MSESWGRNDLDIHREDGPAINNWREDGTKSYEIWYLNNSRHREGGPAHLSWTSTGQLRYELWYFENMLHRKFAPAKITYLPDYVSDWYCFGELITEQVTRWIRANNYPDWSKWDDQIRTHFALTF